MQVQLKCESKNQILKFFSKKGDNDHDSKPKDTSSLSGFSTDDLPKSVKDESGTEVETGISFLADMENSDSQSNASVRPHEGAAKCQLKREYEESTIDTKPTIGEIDKLWKSPILKKKKKGGDKNADDKQLTLTSYFGKS